MKHYQRLRNLREDFDMTQKEVADILRTTQPQYARYEAGEREVPMHHFITLAKYYNVSLDYITELTSTPKTLDGSPFTIGRKLRHKL